MGKKKHYRNKNMVIENNSNKHCKELERSLIVIKKEFQEYKTATKVKATKLKHEGRFLFIIDLFLQITAGVIVINITKFFAKNASFILGGLFKSLFCLTIIFILNWAFRIALKIDEKADNSWWDLICYSFESLSYTFTTYFAVFIHDIWQSKYDISHVPSVPDYKLYRIVIGIPIIVLVLFLLLSCFLAFLDDKFHIIQKIKGHK